MVAPVAQWIEHLASDQVVVGSSPAGGASHLSRLTMDGNNRRQALPNRSRVVGAIICGSAVALAAALVAGVRRRSYWAVALPLLVASLGVLSIAFWIGWTLAMTRLLPPEPTLDVRQAPRGTRPRSPAPPSAN